MTVVNEPGLYSLVLRSRKKEAKAFKRWVTHDVIPSIRKHGAYMTTETMEKVMNDPDFLIGLLNALKDEKPSGFRSKHSIRSCFPKRNIATPC